MPRYMLFLTAVLLMTASAEASKNEAPDIIVMPTKNGNVTFNHKKHVASHPNCKTCHDRKEGKIRGMGKEWAHKVCIGCHEGIMMGPTVCKSCHIKSDKK